MNYSRLVFILIIVAASLATFSTLLLVPPMGQQPHRLSINDAKEVLENYVERLGPKYGVMEIMEFSENFYAVIYEKDTGMGAFEVLIDPYSGEIIPEPGPNMMWNRKYGHHGGMMNVKGSLDEVNVSPSQAREIAEEYLRNRFGERVEVEELMMFYGYYTLDYEVDDEVYGMLSVNSLTGAVWPHTWHGEFLREVEFKE